MRCFRWTDAEQDEQHFGIGDSLGQRWVKAGATLLDKCEVKCGRIGDRLNVVPRGQIGICSRYGGVLPVARPGTACGNCTESRSGFRAERYLVHQLVSTVSFIRLVNLPTPCCACKMRNWSKFT